MSNIIVKPVTVIEIELGEHDENLAEIVEAIKQRRKVLAADKVSEQGIEVGDTVEFSDIIRPKYLIGRTATVDKINAKSVVVTCPDEPGYGRFQGKSRIRCPKTLIAGLA
jgi:uncharacterized protein YkvS